MKNKNSRPAWRGYTFLALILSLVACLATVFLGLARGLVSIQLVDVADPEVVNRWLLISAGVVILGLALYAILEPDKTTRFFTRRQTRYGSNLAVMSLAFVGILIFGSIIAYQNPKTLADLTADKQNTLTEEFQAALASLPEKVTAIGFYSSDSNTASADQLLGNIKANSNGKFDYRFENPDLNPLLAQQEGITGNGRILLQMGDRKEIVPFASEGELYKAFIRLTNPESRAVYFLTGHGEVGLESGEANFASAKRTLENKSYTVGTLNLLTSGRIPEDALSIIIAGPQKPLTEQEVALLKQYVDQGGSLIVLQDPYIFTEFGDDPDPLADYLAAEWGFSLENDVIIDTTNSFGNPLYAVSYLIGQHPTTTDINENLIIIMAQARSITLASQPENVTQTPLIQTAPPLSNANYTWGEMDYVNSAEQGVRYDEGIDLLGPLNMAVAGENFATGGRVVVMGNSYFAASQNFNTYGNGNFFINAIDWAAEQEDLIQFTPRQTTERSFTPPNQIEWIFVLLGSICFMPGLWLAMGAWSWWARRKRG